MEEKTLYIEPKPDSERIGGPGLLKLSAVLFLAGVAAHRYAPQLDIAANCVGLGLILLLTGLALRRAWSKGGRIDVDADGITLRSQSKTERWRHEDVDYVVIDERRSRLPWRRERRPVKVELRARKGGRTVRLRGLADDHFEHARDALFSRRARVLSTLDGVGWKLRNDVLESGARKTAIDDRVRAEDADGRLRLFIAGEASPFLDVPLASSEARTLLARMRDGAPLSGSAASGLRDAA